MRSPGTPPPATPVVEQGIAQADRGRAWIKSMLASRFYPAVFQWMTAAALVVIVGSVLFGSNNSGQNFGMALIWTLWWPLLPLSFLLAGRAWCAICPFAWLTDRLQRVVGVRLPLPGSLARYGPWVIAALFILVTYIDETWRLTVDARRTGYLLLALLVAVVFFGAFFERRTFCRHVCFIGGFAANYSRAGIVELRADADRCRACRVQTCYSGTKRTPGCPLFLRPPDIDDSATCQLCGNCVKACPRDAIRISFRVPTSELWGAGQPRLSDTILAGIVMGVVLVEQVALLRLWIPLVEATAGLLHVDPYVWYPFVYGVLLAGFTVAPLVGMALAAFLSQALAGNPSRAGVLQNFVIFGGAVIPLALAGHVAHSAYYLLARSRTVPFAFLAMVGRFPSVPVRAGWFANSTVFFVEAALLMFGAAASLHVSYRIARRHAPRSPWAACLPHAFLLLVLLAANVCVVVALLYEKGWSG